MVGHYHPASAVGRGRPAVKGTVRIVMPFPEEGESAV